MRLLWLDFIAYNQYGVGIAVSVASKVFSDMFLWRNLSIVKFANWACPVAGKGQQTYEDDLDQGIEVMERTKATDRIIHTPDEVPGYHGALAMDEKKAPNTYHFKNKVDFGAEPIDKFRYISRAFHDLEVEKIWKRVWQFACFEEDIPNVGDYFTYEIAGISIIITRSDTDKFSAFYNACLHRAAMLTQASGHTEKFICPFHAWEFGLDGTLLHVPLEKEFPKVCAGKSRIRSVRVESFNGILFINMNENAEPLMDYLGRLPEFLASFPFKGRRQRVAWGRKIVPGNWKNASEAFREGYHLPIVHHQFRETLSGMENETDIISKNVSRLTGGSLIPNCVTGPEISEQEILDMAVHDFFGDAFSERPIVPEGAKARVIFAEMMRGTLKAQTGLDTSGLSDSEVIESALYHVFPNTVIWGSWSQPNMYRWRPNGQDHTTAIMEVFMFVIHPEGADIPAPAPVEDVPIDQPFASTKNMSQFGALMDQDVSNMELQWRGLFTTPEPGLHYSTEQEMLIRHFHHRLDEELNS